MAVVSFREEGGNCGGGTCLVKVYHPKGSFFLFFQLLTHFQWLLETIKTVVCARATGREFEADLNM